MATESEIVMRVRLNLGFETIRFEPGIPVGMPDIHWVVDEDFPYKAGWIETKDDSKELRPAQAIWARNYWSAGGSVYVLARFGTHVCLIPGNEIPLDRKINEGMAVRTWPSLQDIGWLDLAWTIAHRLTSKGVYSPDSGEYLR